MTPLSPQSIATLRNAGFTIEFPVKGKPINHSGYCAKRRASVKTTPESQALREAVIKARNQCFRAPSYDEIGNQIGMTKHNVYRFIIGEIANPRPENVVKLWAWVRKNGGGE